ncbi:MAG: hypothetical protein JSR56_01490 [Proteobacteria bacterium]|nr:hypothetical protein [Pseudomonadota bacterium]
MVTKRNHKPAGKANRNAGKVTAKPKAAKKVTATRKIAKPAEHQAAGKRSRAKASARPAVQSVAVKPVATTKPVTAPKPVVSRPASVRTAAKAVAAARASAAKRRAPSYIPRSSFGDDWKLGGPIELPRSPTPAAHTPTRKPPKPRAPKPKAISHEQAVANLKALLESRKRKDRGGDAGMAKGA